MSPNQLPSLLSAHLIEVSMHNLVILLAHGSTDESWSDTFKQFTHSARAKYPNTKLAYMELSTPSLSHAVESAVKDGYQSITILPLFLAKGKHLRHDIPKQLAVLKKKFAIEIDLLPPLGEQAELALAVELIIDRHIK